MMMLINDQEASQGEAFQTSGLLDLPEEARPRNPQASYYRARYYDPSIGRFLSEDEVGNDEGENLYVYVRNSPIDSRDPTGFYKLKGFPPDQVGQMNNAIKDAIAKLKADCPSCAGPNGPKIADALQKATFVYKPDLKDCAETLKEDFLFIHIRRVNVARIAFDPNKCCTLASTIAHEGFHLVNPMGQPDHPDQPGGPYDIEKKCFNCGTGHPPK
jgi:RHS repeat-associated protein